MLLCITAISIMGTTEDNKIFNSAMSRKSDTISHDSVSIAVNKNGDFLDQYQNSDCGWGWHIIPDFWPAQSFIPTLNILTRVELYLFLSSYPIAGDIIFSIKKELQGDDLTSITLTSQQLPPNNEPIWIEFDFKDITVVPNDFYILICRGTAGDNNSAYCWAFDTYNPYTKGDSLFSNDYGKSWWKLEFDRYIDCDLCFRTYGFQDNPPNTPMITGETNGKTGKQYSYSLVSTDPDGDDVYYYIDWGDGDSTGWVGPAFSGEITIVPHTWTVDGRYSIQAKTKDTYGVESDWGILTVTMPYSYNRPMLQLLELLFQRFPHTFLIWKHLMNY